MSFLLSKTVGIMVVPPGAFIVLLLLSILALVKDKRKIALGTLSFTLLTFYAVSTEPVRDLILLPLENRYPYPKNPNCDAIVVLGGDLVNRSPAENFHAAVGPSTSKRLYEAYKLWKKIRKPIIVSGGSVYGNSEPESSAMKRFLVEIGVPSKYVIEEGKSRNTVENAKYSKEILKNLKANKVCLITSAFHMPRSVMVFRSFKIKVVPVPADFKVDRTPYNWSSFFPKMGYFKDSSTGIREYVGILYFLLLRFVKPL